MNQTEHGGSHEEHPPSFGLILIGGAMVGSVISHLRIANELAERGYRVHIFWAIDDSWPGDIHPGIVQHKFFSAARYNGILLNMFGWKFSAMDDFAGSGFTNLIPQKIRLKMFQKGIGGFDFIKWSLCGLIRHVSRGVEHDSGILKRFAKVINREKITHLLPNLSVFGPFCHAVKPYVNHEIKYLNIFQGYEVYSNYAEDIGLREDLFRALVQGAKNADYPSLTFSQDYKSRVMDDLGLSDEDLAFLPACVEFHDLMPMDQATELVRHKLEGYRDDIPMVTYMGRQDPEKGIDLLLYAAKILQDRGLEFQLAICGTTAWGSSYREACSRIADNLRLPILKAGYLTNDERTALYRASHSIIYPSIHREPFGMVPVEAMTQSTPVVVPDIGGVAELPFAEGLQAGLNFKSWDSSDLAAQIELLLTDQELYSRFTAQARDVAKQFSVQRVTDLELQMMGILDKAIKPPIHLHMHTSPSQIEVS
ncbi:glycosyltransferase family 4 protein [Planctomycetaceae bacterium]|jgi:glycosyltransferase involved in cell wall biosynthesis|nr:glycosyltransferase family 4 protein [Planctomycetaceae bacterium]MDC0262053.1 glycosyltransferase family 4 protein [Planctomycetaceae bacterium]MDC0273493.1 glycosyltransferase family 4 protein [Planctomycetaceae bacterium]